MELSELPLATALAALVATHAFLDWRSCTSWVRFFPQLGQLQHPSSSISMERIQSAVEEVRLRNARVCVDLMSFGLQLGVVLALVIDSHPQFRLTLLLCYGGMLPFSTGYVQLEGRVQTAAAMFHVFIHLRLMYGSADMSICLLNSVRTTVRAMIGVILLDHKRTAALNMFSIGALVWNYKQMDYPNSCGLVSWDRYVAVEVGIFIAIVALSKAVENLVVERVTAACELEDANQSQKQSLHRARKLLSVLCDADLHLDSDLRIVGSSQRFGHLLMSGLTSDMMSGKPFLDYIESSEHDSFKNFVLSNSLQQDANGTEMPDEHSFDQPQLSGCLRSTLRGAGHITFPVEIFHVPIPVSGGCAQFQHLIGIKECSGSSSRGPSISGSDCRGPLSVEELTSVSRRPRSHDSRSSCTESETIQEQGHREPLLSLRGLSKISVTVDAFNPCLPIQQVEFVCHDAAPVASLLDFLSPCSSELLKAKITMAAIQAAASQTGHVHDVLAENVDLDLDADLHISAGVVKMRERLMEDQKERTGNDWMRWMCLDFTELSCQERVMFF
eukprot:TRINITY_DN8636_c0_g1_i5.p1 TRINITY_DN8636_c0_g1~~TRINITY_DN8636_c0_g1_i5.p1  ORF type:complete len:557 (+),score=80.92 TRINITY_DN8636_c0_g1_i5:105-1775(+)